MYAALNSIRLGVCSCICTVSVSNNKAILRENVLFLEPKRKKLKVVMKNTFSKVHYKLFSPFNWPAPTECLRFPPVLVYAVSIHY